MNTAQLSVQEVSDKKAWESFIPLKEKGVFLQSWNSKRLHESLGNKVWALQLKKGSSIIGQTLVIHIKAKRGSFLYLPYGPVMLKWEKEPMLVLLKELKKIGDANHAGFLRSSPYISESSEYLHLYKSLGFRNAPIHMLAETLWVVDLQNKSQANLMAETDKKHRNLIRRAEKEGVEIKMENSEKALREFMELHLETVKRHNFTPYPKNYFRNQVRIFEEDDQAVLMSAVYKGKTLASGIIMYYGKGGFYHHGASSSDPEYRKIPASYLLQWEAIKEAKARSCDFYSLWGIAPYQVKNKQRVYANPKHPFVGITHFKTGFGGHQEDLLPCQDLPLTWKYWVNWLIESVRKWKRGF